MSYVSIGAGMASSLAGGAAVFFIRAAILGDRLSAWIASAFLTQLIFFCIGVAIGMRIGWRKFDGSIVWAKDRRDE